jgi:zinc D-Ala-D-Ala carboxypeptidase
MKLTENFSLAELTRSEAATRKGVDNTPTPEAIENLRALCEKVLQPLRDAMGQPMRVNSAYRGPAANTAVGGSKTSQHMSGEAADIEFDGVDNKLLAKKIVELKLPFDQIILEFYKDGDPNSGWVHVSHKRGGKQRGEVLRAVSEGGKTKYLPGLG